MNGVIWQAKLTPAFDDLVTQQSAHRAMGIVDGQLEFHAFALLQCRLAEPDQVGIVQSPVEPVILGSLAVNTDVLTRLLCRRQQRREIKTAGFPMRDGRIELKYIDTTNHLVECSKTQLGHDPPHLFGHQKQIIHYVFRSSMELFTQDGILGCNSHRTGIEVALAHHDAPKSNQRGS